jgi:formylglycine-generating enzyme required for sulfatase activity
MGAPEGEEGSTDDERPQRWVTVRRPFALGRTAVTFAMWDAAVAADFKPPPGAEAPNDEGWGRDDRPVIKVNWHDAQAYCAWLNQSLGLRPGTYHLPSEAEFEYACRAGTTTPFSFGETISTDQANYDGKDIDGKGKRGVYRERSVPVGSLPANPWGLHEMHGNVWEWVEDTFNRYPSVPTDSSPRVAGDESRRVLRGGSWLVNPRNLRSANRNGIQPDDRDYLVGFRVARTLG